MDSILSRLLRPRTFGVVALLVVGLLEAGAHDPGLSTLTVRPGPDGFDLCLILSLKDAAGVGGSDRVDGALTARARRGDLEAALTRSAAGALEVRLDDAPVPARVAGCRIDDSGNVTVQFTVSGLPAGRLWVRSRWLALLPPGHRQFLSLQDAEGAGLADRLLSAGSDAASLDVPSRAAAQLHAGAGGRLLEFLGLGLAHILTGYDHLLFLFCLLVVSRKVGTALKTITCFTVAHSITLLLSTLDLVHLPSRVVEPMIAASIVFVALENLFRSEPGRGRLLLVFGFGLIHGLGFASALRELGVGAAGTEVALPLFSFNLGVELGQLLIAAPLVPLIQKLSERPVFTTRWVPACSIVAALLGCGWVVARLCLGS